MSNLKELQKIAQEKALVLDGIRSDIYRMESFLKREVERKVREKFGEAEHKAGNEFAAAQQALRDELDKRAVAEAEKKIPYPIGTKMVYWEKENFSDGWRAPCIYGVLEVFKKGDDYSSNLRWNAPNPGDIIIRVLTKDGKPGKKFEKLFRGHRHEWVPEGLRPRTSK